MNGDIAQAQRRVFAVVALVFMLMAIVYVLLPFKVAGAVSCGPPLFGAHPRTTTNVGLIRPKEDCGRQGKSRLVTAAFVVFLASVVVVAAVVTKGESQACVEGRHDDCKEWWPVALGGIGRRLACNCSCHG